MTTANDDGTTTLRIRLAAPLSLFVPVVVVVVIVVVGQHIFTRSYFKRWLKRLRSNVVVIVTVRLVVVVVVVTVHFGVVK